MTEIQAPLPLPLDCYRTVFLAGSIEMGRAERWQDGASKKLQEANFTVFNPRRDDWDASWEQSIDNPQFREQVEWELNALQVAERVLLYFSPGTQSPISLLELGLNALSRKLVVVCPEGFWRKGNVDIACRWYGIPQASDIETAIRFIVKGNDRP